MSFRSAHRVEWTWKHWTHKSMSTIATTTGWSGRKSAKMTPWRIREMAQHSKWTAYIPVHSLLCSRLSTQTVHKHKMYTFPRVRPPGEAGKQRLTKQAEPSRDCHGTSRPVPPPLYPLPPSLLSTYPLRPPFVSYSVSVCPPVFHSLLPAFLPSFAHSHLLYSRRGWKLMIRL